MKIVFTGGGTGGHFYPVIAIAQAIREKIKERKIIPPILYFMAPTAYSPRALFDNEIQFVHVPAGKMRRYFSPLNITDIFKTVYGCISALFHIFSIYPDVVFGKGGYGSFPVLLAARILRIPVMIHESDSQPGRVNRWAGKFARKIAVSYSEAAKYFKTATVANTGNPIRKDVIDPLKNGADEFLHLEQNTPVIFVIGGSQGSKRINEVILDALPELLNRYQIIHQTGQANMEDVLSMTTIILKDHPFSYRYHPFDYMNELSIRMAAGTAESVISRGGSSVFEIAAWGLPSIIIPLPEHISHDQTSNALAYAKTGAASVIEDNNLSAHILIEEIDRIHNNPLLREKMAERSRIFAKRDSAIIIADALINIALEHEK